MITELKNSKYDGIWLSWSQITEMKLNIYIIIKNINDEGLRRQPYFPKFNSPKVMRSGFFLHSLKSNLSVENL